MAVKKVFLDPGHGGSDPGAVSKGYEEKLIALSIATEVRTQLLALGYDVRMSRTSDLLVGLTQRCNLANSWGADCFVSIHLNADPDPDEPGMLEARGEEIWIYPGSTKGLELAKPIADMIKLDFPDEPFRGIKPGNLAVVRQTTMPACLIEVGFVDNSTTARELSNPAIRTAMAHAIALGIDHYAIEGS